MSSWGTKRRNFIITIFLSGFFIILATTSYILFYEEPTCFDGKQNGLERGIDCGGSCSLLCSGQALAPLVKWNRFFEIVPGLYNVVAYVENQNTNAGTSQLAYKFTLYDRNNAILAEKTGSIALRPKEVIPITTTGLNTGKLIPARMSFEILNEIVWEKASPRQPVIVTKDQELKFVDDSPRVTAILDNVGYANVTDINTVVILYDKEGNAVGVSSTYVDEIVANRSKNIQFTWPQNFVGEVARFEIIPLYESN